MSDEHGQRFDLDISTTEKRYQDKWSPSTLADYCWTPRSSTGEIQQKVIHYYFLDNVCTPGNIEFSAKYANRFTYFSSCDKKWKLFCYPVFFIYMKRKTVSLHSWSKHNWQSCCSTFWASVRTFLYNYSDHLSRLTCGLWCVCIDIDILVNCNWVDTRWQ